MFQRPKTLFQRRENCSEKVSSCMFCDRFFQRETLTWVLQTTGGWAGMVLHLNDRKLLRGAVRVSLLGAPIAKCGFSFSLNSEPSVVLCPCGKKKETEWYVFHFRMTCC